MTEPWYCTREDVASALDVKLTARISRQIDRATEAGARSVEGLLKRTFRPVLATRYFDWPNDQRARPWRLWLDANELISLTTLTSGGVTIASTDYFLEPVNSGPPYTRIEIDLASSAAFSSGDTHQRAIAAVGLWGFRNNETPAGLLAEALDTTETGVDVTDSSLVGVGDVLRIDSERMTVTDKATVDTGQNSSALTAAASAVTITGITAGTVKAGEVILVDSERMLVIDVTGTTLTVKRGWDGSVLAAHSINTDIYALRSLTVERGALGTTAATHLDTTAIVRHLVPGLVRELNIAEAINTVQQEAAGYARRDGLGEERGGGRMTVVEATGRGLEDLRSRAVDAFGRKARMRAV